MEGRPVRAAALRPNGRAGLRVRTGLLAAAALAVAVPLVRRSQRAGVSQELFVVERAVDPAAFTWPYIFFNDRGHPHSWLMPKMLKANFPVAKPGYEAARRMLDALKPYGIHRNNVVYGHSISSDEINGDKGHLTRVLTQHFGTSYFLGGIGGVPYVGKTGFGAFAAHVPQDGHVVLVYGPHIGMCPEGEMGKFFRDGQDDISTACDAAMTAWDQLTSGEQVKADPQDLQLSWLREKLAPHVAELSKSSNLAVDLALKAYEIVEEEVFKIVNTNFGMGNLVLLGGIQINMPYPIPGYWAPMHFSVRAQGKKPTDLMFAFE